MIEPPPRSTSAGTVITLLASVLLLVFLLFNVVASGWLLVASALLVAASIWFNQPYAVHISVFSLIWIFISTMMPGLRWPLHFLLPLAAYASLAWTIRSLRTSVLWLHPGRCGRDIRLLVIVTVLLSGAGVLLWYFAADPDLEPFFKLLPEMPIGLLLLAGLAFAILNAMMEEGVFRGILMQSLEGAVGAGMTVVLIQAALFGAMHFPQGAFPNGVWGVGMAFVYGIVLGLIRHRSQGLLAPVIAHILADIVIFAIIAGAKLSAQV
ncbi:MAG: CPBP family intramembrane metalloprotease [Candidatus Marinimicrobia bacterium]|nr:CPBP family intramembrane metalloprotease [Candidatus Neomarinimicrobiota bacterium]